MKQPYILCLLFFLLSCQENKTERITRLVAEWQGKEIVFPQDMVFTRYIKDTVDWEIPENNYKVLVYVDSLGCTSCKLQLRQWKSFVSQADSLTGGSVPFLFFFHQKDYREIHFLLKQDQFDLPVCIDRDDSLNKLNQFPSDITFQTFLLDRENKVVVIGNPIHNLAVRDIYLTQITGKENPSDKTVRTTAIADQTEIHMGSFPKTEKRKALFYIRNTGENPLVILGTSTTCGCTSVAYDKHPANPGEELKVEIEMTPKEAGFFSEVITVKCNTSEFIKLQIKGHSQ